MGYDLEIDGHHQCTSPLVKRVCEYWKNKCSGKQLPKSQDFNLNDIPDCKPYIYFLEYHQRPIRVLFKFQGKKAIEIEGKDINGMWCADIDAWDSVDKLIEYNKALKVIRRGKPWCGAEAAYWIEGDLYFEFANLPMSDDGETITGMLTLCDYSYLIKREAKSREYL